LGRKIDSEITPLAHERFAKAASWILLLPADYCFQRFHTAWVASGQPSWCSGSYGVLLRATKRATLLVAAPVDLVLLGG
jgi:hypothetical protein